MIRRSSPNGQRYVILKAINGQVLAKSEGYSSEIGAQNCIQAVKRISSTDVVEERV